MTNADQDNRKSPVAAIAGLLVLLGVLAFIGWGLWLAYHPVPVPLQGQVEARTLNISPKISARGGRPTTGPSR